MDDTRPAWLRPFALVRGELTSAPLDLPARMERLYEALRRDGWTVAVKSIGTDFEGPLGLPTPRAQALELYLHRKDRPYTEREAAEALARALSGLEVSYSAVRAWLGELQREVVEPTVNTLRVGAPWALGALALGALLVLGARR